MKGKKVLINTSKWVLIIVVLVITIFPIYWVIVSAFKLRVQIFSIPPLWFFKPTFKNFIDVLVNRDVLGHVKNSAIIATSSTAICVIIGSFAGYSLARFKFHNSNFISFLLLFGRLIPPIAFVIPYFIILGKLGLFDTHLGIVLTHMGFNMPFAIFLLRSFFLGIPQELEDAGLVDGCTPFTVFFRIVLPLAAPGIGTTIIFVFLYSWNEFLYSFMFSQVRAVTLPVLAASFVTPIGVLWGELFAVSVITMFPTIFLGIIVRKYFVKGLSLGAVKG